jgi:flagellin
LTEDVEFTVTGENGSQNFSFAAGTAISDIADTINNNSESTGITAYSIQGDTQLRLTSNEYGASNQISVEQQTGNLFAAEGNTVQDSGQDATLQVNGQEVQTDGLGAEISNNNFSGTLEFNEGDPAATTIAQTGYDQDTLTDATASRTAEVGNVSGGMQLQLGEGANASNREVFGLNDMSSNNIGQVEVGGQSYSLADLMSGGTASLANNPEAALAVIDQAISDVSGERARIGAYQANNLQTNINSLSVAVENITATESSIMDTDYAKATADLFRMQVLEQVGIMNIQSANTNASNVLKLLGA